MNPFPYPPGPPNARQVKPSPAFRKAALKVTGAIVLFFIVYVLMVLAAIALAIGLFYAAVWIISGLSNFFGLALGLGLIAVGASVIFFLVKFIFSSSKNEDESRIRIFEHEQPELFAFVRRLANDTQTKFPKKIFISPAVNACVFYNSNFWSMLFPVRKNLEIGLGLVNSVNVSEFKAIMAHEFGHFSQQSMKLGSFTYNVNRIIYNMLYENTGYARLISGWASIDGVFGFFANITVFIAQGIQSILKGMYQLINKHYMGLSRQMEYNADAIAANVAGANNLVNSLNRLDLSQSSFNTAIEKANEFLKQQRKSSNIFSNHSHVMATIAQEFRLPVREGLPEITTQFLKNFNKSRINYKDQWASHPTNEEREAELLKLNQDAATDTTSAWTLFRNPAALQKNATDQVYADVENRDQLAAYNDEEFKEHYRCEAEHYRLPESYRKYYDNRYVESANWPVDPGSEDNGMEASLHDLLTDEHCQLPELVRANENDIETLKAISDKRIDVKTFDFDGKKYDRLSAYTIIEQLETEVAEQKKRLAELDERLYRMACHRALGKGQQHALSIRNALNEYNRLNETAGVVFELCSKIMDNIAPFYEGNLTIDEVNFRVDTLRNDLGIKLKARLRELLADEKFTARLTSQLRDDMETFISKTQAYFINNEFQSDELDLLVRICNEVSNELGLTRWTAYKTMLVEQAAVL